MKLLVVSDTHGINNWTELKKIIDYDIVLHAGDHLMSNEWMIKNTDYYVDGNNDWGNKKEEFLVINNIKIGLVHGDLFKIKNYHTDDWNYYLKMYCKKNNLDILIFGHTHKDIIYKEENIYYLNPGSVSKPKLTSSNKTYLIIEINENSEVNIEIKNINNSFK